MSSKNIRRYTIGVLLSPNFGRVVLLQKTKPQWQAGFFNFPGGKVEVGETLEVCIAREFAEECGYVSDPEMWRHFGVMAGPGWQVDILCTIAGTFDKVCTAGEEKVGVYDVGMVTHLPTLGNVSWVLHAAIDYLRMGHQEGRLSFIKILYAESP